MMRRFFLLALLFSTSLCSAEAVWQATQIAQQGAVGTVSDAVLVPAGASMSFCQYSASGAPCTNKAATYTDAMAVTLCNASEQFVLNAQSTCVANLDSQNHGGVWLKPGKYAYTFTINGTTQGPYYVVAGADPTAATPFTSSLKATGGQSQINNLVSAGTMKCDGNTDDTSALSSALKAAAGVKNRRVLVPPGICMIAGGTISIPENVWLAGAGQFKTTLKLKNSQNNYLLGLGGANTGVTLTDMTLDGNKANQTNRADLLTLSDSLTTVSKLTVQRVTFQSAWSRGIAIFQSSYVGGGPRDVSISNCLFLNNGTNNGSDTTGAFGDIGGLPGASRVRVHHNVFIGTGGTAIFLGVRAGATSTDVTISPGNVFKNVLGFGVALGGGNGSVGGTNFDISDNVFDMLRSLQNIIDLAFWSDGTVANNVITLSSVVNANNGIADAPPSQRIQVIGNRIYGACASTAAPGTQNGITLGMSNGVISNNSVSCAGGAGIVLLGGNTTKVTISNNRVKNNSQAGAGNHDGIEFFLGAGGRISNVTVKGNVANDDQAKKTQGYGIGLATSGEKTGYSNFLIEGNDVSGNKTGPIRMNTSGATGVSVLNNTGSALGRGRPLLPATAPGMGSAPGGCVRLSPDGLESRFCSAQLCKEDIPKQHRVSCSGQPAQDRASRLLPLFHLLPAQDRRSCRGRRQSSSD